MTIRLSTYAEQEAKKAESLPSFSWRKPCLALVGGALGLVLASTLGAITVSTMNWQTFSELAFRFTMTFEIVAKALCFVLAMGLLGGFLPALRAARLGIVEALRTS
jgi:putative ABC transport system permease protein